MEEVEGEAAIDFIPTICFVKRGVTKERLDKVVLTPNELTRIIKDTKDELQESDDEEGSDQESMVTSDHENTNATEDPDDEFAFNNYDEEGDAQVASIGNIAVVDEATGDNNDDDDDSEAEDEIIKPNDNLILVGHVQDDVASMEVWVFNEEQESFYAHHDFLLPSFPLCIEWFNHDPGSDKDGNLYAVGHMDPIITVWDLDIQDSVEPVFRLGSKGSRKKNKPKYGHKDAVLDLSWNKHFPHIMSSGSVDKTVILWDLDEGQPHTTIKNVFTDKVQSIKFHPTEAQNLLTGCADKIVRLFDCRDLDNLNTNMKKWEVNSEVEKVVWNLLNTNYFIVGTSNGELTYFDIRTNKSLWSINAHSDEVSDICFNTEIENLLTTSSVDGYLKVWKFDHKEIKEVYQHDFSLGRLQCMKQCPENPFTFAFGGEKIPRFKVFNIKNFEAVRKTFKIDEQENMDA